MTDDDARTLAQSDPIPVLTARWGNLSAAARKTVARLNDDLRELDTVTGQLAKHGLTVATDLGPVGNAAAAARVTVAEHKQTHDRPGFQMPRQAA